MREGRSQGGPPDRSRGPSQTVSGSIMKAITSTELVFVPLNACFLCSSALREIVTHLKIKLKKWDELEQSNMVFDNTHTMLFITAFVIMPCNGDCSRKFSKPLLTLNAIKRIKATIVRQTGWCIAG